MMILKNKKSVYGSYPTPQTFPSTVCPAEYIIFPEEFLSEYYKSGKSYFGFVDITDDGEYVLTCVWNEEAYQAYVASLEPEPIPEPEVEPDVWDELAEAYKQGVQSAYDQ